MRFNPVEFRSYFFCGLLISTHDKTVSLALQVSMFDLTIQLETESETIYRDVCLKIKEASSTPPLQSVLRYCMKMSEENSASSVFVSEPHSSIVDGKSGCQVRITSFWIKQAMIAIAKKCIVMFVIVKL